MSGNLYWRRPGVAEMKVYLGIDPVTGKKKYKSKTFHGTKREAQIALAEFVTDSLAPPGQREDTNQCD